MKDYTELVDAFIGAAILTLDAGLPRTAKRMLETHWLEAASSAEQRRRLTALQQCLEVDLLTERLSGNGGLIDLHHTYAKQLLPKGKIGELRLEAINNYRSSLSKLPSDQISQ